jgi:hypothetical protein
MNAIFNFKRAGLLIQRHFIERFQNELIFWGIAIICMMFLRINIGGILGFAIIAGIIRTCQFFREIHSPTNRINYFMIPATQIEKFVVSLLYTIVYFWSMLFVVYVIGNFLGTWLNNLLANIGLLSDMLGIHYRNLSWIIVDSIKYEGTNSVLTVCVVILIFQSIFLLGGIYFKRSQLFKTFLALAVIGFFLGVISVIEAKYLLVDSVEMLAESSNANINISGKDMPGLMKTISGIFLYLQAPFLWLVSYIRLIEKEV